MIEVNQLIHNLYKYFEYGLSMLVHPFYRGIEGEVLYYKLDNKSIEILKEYNHLYNIPWDYDVEQFLIPFCFNPSEKNIDLKNTIGMNLIPQNFICNIVKDNPEDNFRELVLNVSSRGSYFRIYALSKYFDVVDKLSITLTPDLKDWNKNSYDISFVSPETGLGVLQELKIKTLFIPFE